MSVPYTFRNAVGSIPLSELDDNFNSITTGLAAPTGATIVGFNPTGTVGAITVQTAIAELDTEKATTGSVTLKTNIADLAATTGATLVGTIQTGTGAVARTVDAKLKETVSVKDFGAVGDGVTDDGVALNLAFAYLRSKLASIGTIAAIELDLSGGVYATTISINATGFRSWGWKVSNGTIKGLCSGFAVLDMVGSRGGCLDNIVVYGDATSTPSFGIKAARSTVSGYEFCDNMLWNNVSVIGYYTVSAIYTYGQETTTYQHCRFWTYKKDTYAAIHSGNNIIPFGTSYLTPMTGETSYVNNKYINCDYRFLPIGISANITGISKATEAIVSVAAHPFINGDTIVLGTVSGMTQINNTKAVLSSCTPTSFTLTGINSTGFSTYTSGGFCCLSQTVPTVYFARGEQHHFDTCYIVNYGTDSFTIDLASTQPSKSIWIDCLFEGEGSRSHVRFTSITTGKSIFDFKLETYNTHSRDYILSTDNSASNMVTIYNSKISVAGHAYSTPTLLDNYINFGLYGTEIFYPANTGFDYTAIPNTRLNGYVTYINTGERINLNGLYYDSRSTTTFTPVVTSTVGTITSYTSSGSVTLMGAMASISLTIIITNNGTGSGALRFVLPYAAKNSIVFVGRENSASGYIVQGTCVATSSNMNLYTYNNLYPAATGATIIISGTYEIQ